MIIKDFKIEYYDDVISLHREAMIQIGAYKGEGVWDDDLSDISGTYLQANGEFIIGLLDNRVVAMGAFRDNKDGYAEVKRMRVLPAYQGRGFGKIIYRELEERAKPRFDGFFLETSEIQKSAQNLYLSVGFEEIERSIIDNFKCIIYRKQFS